MKFNVEGWNLGSRISGGRYDDEKTKNSQKGDRQRWEQFRHEALLSVLPPAEAEVKVLSIENLQPWKFSPVKPYSSSEYGFACYAYCWECAFVISAFLGIQFHFSHSSSNVTRVITVN